MATKLPSREILLANFSYDPETGVLRWRVANGTRAPAGAVISPGRFGFAGKGYRTSRIIWKMLHDEEPHTVEHRDLCNTNDKESNLRAADHSQNMQNLPVRKDNKLGVKGVVFRFNKYWTGVWVNKRHINLGSFRTLEEAVAARKVAVLQHHGEFARTK